MTDSTSEARAFLMALGAMVRRDLAPNDSAISAAKHAIGIGYSARTAVKTLEGMGHNLTKAKSGGMVLRLLRELPADPELEWRSKLPVQCPHGNEAANLCKPCRLDAGDPREIERAIREGLAS